MRILFASASSGSRGGGEIFLVYLAAALRARGHTLGLWVSDHSRMDELAAAFAPHGDVLRSAYPWFYDSWHRGLLGELTTTADQQRWLDEWKAWQPDIVHFNKQCLEDGLDLLRAAAGLTVPCLATIHITQTARSLGARFGWLRDRRARRALSCSHLPLVAVSADRGRELQKLTGPATRVEVIDNGVPLAGPCLDRDALREREGIPAGGFCIVAVGRLEAQKNPLRFLEELKRIHSVFPEIRARWIGGGRMEAEWLQRRSELELDAVVQYDGWRSDIATVLPAFDLFLHTAYFEGQPLALLEAMSAGLPAVVSAGVQAQLPAHLRDCVIPLEPTTDWSLILSDRTELTRLANAGSEAVRAHHSVAAMATRYEQLYGTL